MKRFYDLLTKQELVRFLSVVDSAVNVHTDDQMQRLLRRVKTLVPCENIVSCLGQIDPHSKFSNILKPLNVSYPIDWIMLYAQRNYADVDPVLRSHFGRFKTQVWSETFQLATSPEEKAFIHEAAQFHLVDGVTGGIVCTGNPIGSLFSFAGKHMGEHHRHSTLLTALIPHFHLALMRSTFSPSIVDISFLTKRERETLKWMKEGKTNWEISHILNLGERTVKFHVQNILKKLRASTRGHAVAIALEGGFVEL